MRIMCECGGLVEENWTLEQEVMCSIPTVMTGASSCSVHVVSM